MFNVARHFLLLNIHLRGIYLWPSCYQGKFSATLGLGSWKVPKHFKDTSHTFMGGLAQIHEAISHNFCPLGLYHTSWCSCNF